MVAFKNRYFVMEIFVDPNKELMVDDPIIITHFNISKAIKDSILINFGECGLASSLGSFQVKYVNPITKLCIIRTLREEYQKVWAAITMVRSIGNCPVVFNLLDLSGSIRACKNAGLKCEEAKFEQQKLIIGDRLTDELNQRMLNCLEKIKTTMALSLTHQIGALSGTPIQAESVSNSSGDSTATVSAAAMWRSPEVNLKCKVHRQGPNIDAISPPMSPCRSTSPMMRGIRPDLSVACMALATDLDVPVALGETQYKVGSGAEVKGRGVPVYVMMPLDSVTMNNTVNRRKAMNVSLQALKSAGVEGVMLDVWWGLVEREVPGVYNWGGYTELLEMAKQHGLKVQAVMSFHQCGGNVGDSVTIPLPKWVVEEIDKDPDLAYTDQWGRRNYEYVSLGCDTLPVLKGRTPVQCYSDFMCAFRDNFKHLLGDTIVEIQVGMGPAGELRYPSYPEQNGTWKFPGIGAFQCYDKYMLSSLKAAAEAAGKPEWGHTGPTDAGHYNNWPEDTPFFRKEGGGWNSPYGEFFLHWYSQMLLDHGERILSSAKAIFEGVGVKISVKIAGIHWHYGTRSHAPELTAGYYNTRFRDGYLPVAHMLSRHGAIFNFTCIEMRDHEQPQEALCAPEKLVRQVALATQQAQVPLAGENALPRYDEYAHEQILRASLLDVNANSGDREMCAFTYLRMNPNLFQADNWRKFVAFVKKMKEGKDAHRCWEQVEREAEHFVHVTKPLVQEAAVALMHQ